MDSRDEVRLRHMLDAAKKAIVFAQGGQWADLNIDEMLALAVIRLVEVLFKPTLGLLIRIPYVVR